MRWKQKTIWVSGKEPHRKRTAHGYIFKNYIHLELISFEKILEKIWTILPSTFN